MKERKIRTITTCPVCEGTLRATHLECESCGTVLQGEFLTCSFCNLPQDLYDFLVAFVTCEGVIRELESDLGISYPAVKNRIRKLKAKLGLDGVRQISREERTEEVLLAVKEGQMSVRKAICELDKRNGGSDR